MKRILGFVLVYCLFTSAQDKSFRIEFDYSRFSDSDSTDYVEFYYTFYQEQFSVVQQGNQKFAQGELDLILVRKNSTDTVISRRYQFKSDLSDSMHSKTVVGTLGFQVPVGLYRCFVKGVDINSPKNLDTISFDIQVLPRPKEKFSLSDIQIASAIKKSEDVNSPFYKNTYEVIPNPSNVFGQQLSVIYYYAELYNLNKGTGSEVLKVESNLLNSSNILLITKKKLVSGNSGSIVEVGTVNINKLASGTYTLTLTITDTVKQMKAVASRKIFLYNPGVVDTISAMKADNFYMASEFAMMSAEEIDEAYAQGKYIASKVETEQWEKLGDLEARRKFMFTFWRNRDKIPNTPENEFKYEYEQRIIAANDKYSTFKKKGWQSDRGRVYLQHGEPSEIERFPSEVDCKPYEVWQYNNLEGGVQFVFADLSGFSDYQLLHSTLRGELRDDNYMRRIKQTN